MIQQQVQSPFPEALVANMTVAEIERYAFIYPACPNIGAAVLKHLPDMELAESGLQEAFEEVRSLRDRANERLKAIEKIAEIAATCVAWKEDDILLVSDPNTAEVFFKGLKRISDVCGEH